MTVYLHNDFQRRIFVRFSFNEGYREKFVKIFSWLPGSLLLAPEESVNETTVIFSN